MRKVPDKQVALVSVAGYKTSLMSIRNLLRHVFVNMGNGSLCTNSYLFT